VRVPIDTSRLEVLLVADADPAGQYERGKSWEMAGCCQAIGPVAPRSVRSGGGEDGRVGPAGAGSLGAIAETRERLDPLEVELARVGGHLDEAA
jgi:hypothetical protein